MQDNRKHTLIDTLLNYIPVELAFLMPVFFLPITSEYFEFNKLALLSVATGVMLLAWIAKMIINKTFGITRSLMDMGFLALFVSFLLSSIFSVDKTASIFGSYGRWFPSLFGILVIGIYYYVVVTNTNTLNTVRNFVIALMGGASLSSLVVLLSYFGIRLSSAPYFQSMNFNLTGSSVTASIVAGIGVIISLVFIIYSKQTVMKVISAQFLVINVITILLIGSAPAWVTLVVGVLAALYFMPLEKIRANNVALLGMLGIVAALVLVMAIPSTRDVIVNSNYPSEISLSSRDSRMVSFSVLRDFPVLGSGPSTFYMNFPQYRSPLLNASPFWNVRFDKPQNEVFNIIGSLGILGIIAGLVFAMRLGRTLLLSKPHSDESGMKIILAGIIIALAGSMLLTYATVLSTFLLVGALAMLVSHAALTSDRKVAESVHFSVSSGNVGGNSMSILGDMGEKTEILPYVVSLPLVALVLFGSFHFYKMYAGEYYIRQSVNAAALNDGSTTYEMQANAINVNSIRDSYHNSYALTNIALANSLAGKETLTDEEKTTIQTLIAQAIRSVRVTTELLNPMNVTNWETRALIYRSMMGVAQDADQWAIAAYNNAIQLDPTNPRLRLDLGGVYFAREDYLSAANLFKQATSLKPDYANAHYNFAHALMKLNAYADAQREFEFTQRLVDADSEDYAAVTAELENAKKLATEAGAAAQPTVEQLEGSAPTVQPDETVRETQEPLVRPGEEERVTLPDQIPGQQPNDQAPATEGQGTEEEGAAVEGAQIGTPGGNQ